jgi:hypothetical protein
MPSIARNNIHHPMACRLHAKMAACCCSFQLLQGAVAPPQHVVSRHQAEAEHETSA